MNTKEKKSSTAEDLQKRSNNEKNNQKKSQKDTSALNRKSSDSKQKEGIEKSGSYEQSEEEPETPAKGLDVGDDPDEIKRKSPKME